LLQQAIALHQRGQLDQAARCYGKLLKRSPRHADAMQLLGMVEHQRGQGDRAIEHIRGAIAIDPSRLPYHLNLSMVLRALGRPQQAAQASAAAVALAPHDPRAHFNLALALEDCSQSSEAIEAYRRAVELAPQHKSAHKNLGGLLRDQGRIAEAIACFRAAEQLDPKDFETQSNLASTLRDAGALDDAIDRYRAALRNDAGNARIDSNLVFALSYHAGLTPQQIYDEHRRWAREHEAPIEPMTMTPEPASARRDRPLRIGYVSPDFRSHSVGFFIEPIIAAHDPSRERFVVTCYSDVAKPDEVTDRIARSASCWRCVRGLSDEQLAELVRKDGIDILVDLAGHTAGGRLLTFGRRPAPIQVSYLGYPATTGMDRIDYRLSDARADPEGVTDRWHSEQLVRLDHGFLCYQPPAGAPAPATRKSGEPLTFGSFNNLTKLSPPLLDLWCQLLQRLPEASLLLKSRPLADPQVRQRLVQALTSKGIDPARLELLGHTASRDEHLGLYGRVDIALDSFPYNGTTTTCEALWMGVPVIVLAGAHHAGRVGVSLLTQVGLADLIAPDASAYLQLACELGQDEERLADLRATLRPRLVSSTLLDAARFTAELERAYEQMRPGAGSRQRDKT